MPAPEKIKYLIIHTSDSKWGSVEVVRKWHTDPPPLGRGWQDIGYQYLITNGFMDYQSLKANKRDPLTDGRCWLGRDLDHDGDVDEELGAHCVGFNDKSLGICLIGADGAYTPAQMVRLYAICLELCGEYHIPVANVLGHYETENGRSQGKTCPDIDMPQFRKTLQLMVDVHKLL